jgi:hypothetical protein
MNLMFFYAILKHKLKKEIDKIDVFSVIQFKKKVPIPENLKLLLKFLKENGIKLEQKQYKNCKVLLEYLKLKKVINKLKNTWEWMCFLEDLGVKDINAYIHISKTPLDTPVLIKLDNYYVGFGYKKRKCELVFKITDKEKIKKELRNLILKLKILKNKIKKLKKEEIQGYVWRHYKRYLLKVIENNSVSTKYFVIFCCKKYYDLDGIIIKV